MRRQLRTAALAAALLAGVLALPATARSSRDACATPQRVQAFHANGSPARSIATACTHRTGFLTAESHIRVAPDGTVVQQPAETTPGVAGTNYLGGVPAPRPQTQLSPAGIAISRNGGSSWAMTRPAGLFWEAQDGALHIDPATGRMYYYALTPASVPQGGDVAVQDQVPIGYAHLMTSGDGGRSWFHTQVPGFLESENPRFASGRAPSGQPQPIAGESVGYWCGNTMLFTFVQRDCYRTLNGGLSWQPTSTFLRRGIPVHAECGRNEEVFDASDGNYPQVARDGTLWSLVACGGTTFLARSTDEGLTFPVLRSRSGAPMTVPGFTELRIDPQGNLYGVQAVNDHLVLRTSRDGGQSWSAPLDLTAPAVRKASLRQWALAVRGVGQVAVSYLTAHPGGGFDGTVTVTRNALAKDPVLLASTVHDGRAVLVSQSQQAMDDYIDVDIAPDGSAWAAFYGDCGVDPICSDSGQAPNPLAKVSVLTHLG
jgi:hypothetical protein